MTQALDSSWKRSLRRRLLAWFQGNARDLPWRRTRDPYRIWVSEIMLQQTQVVTVVPYYQRFIKRFSTIERLARADEQTVLRLWEGLGYYRRARQLHHAAKLIVKDHNGQFPSDIDVVRSLPGIGRYTAGAILSIALDQRQPILEANSTRVLCRLVAYRKDPTNASGQRFLWDLAEQLLPAKNASQFNQSLMELGSQLCTPRDPLCGLCPLESLCPTCNQGIQHSVPRPKRKTKYEDICEAAVVIRRRGKLLLRLCEDNERWAGLWDFPRFTVRSGEEIASRKELTQHVERTTGLSITLGAPRHTIKHGVTRFRITLLCYEAESVCGRTVTQGGELRWVGPKECTEYPLSVTGRKLSRLIMKNV